MSVWSLPDWNYLTTCTQCGNEGERWIHMRHDPQHLKAAKTQHGYVSKSPSNTRCAKCHCLTWRTKARPKGYLPVTEGQHLPPSRLRWIATCHTCNQYHSKPAEFMGGDHQWKLNSPYGKATTNRQHPFLYDGGPERPGWDCLRDAHNVTMGFVPITYLPATDGEYL